MSHYKLVPVYASESGLSDRHSRLVEEFELECAANMEDCIFLQEKPGRKFPITTEELDGLGKSLQYIGKHVVFLPADVQYVRMTKIEEIPYNEGTPKDQQLIEQLIFTEDI